jgi:hypothetical protein
MRPRYKTMKITRRQLEQPVVLGKNKGGRPRGSLSRIAEEAREKAKATGLLPHEFLLSVARGEAIYTNVVQANGDVLKQLEVYGLPVRIDAAKAAAPYYAPKISTVEVISGVPDNELDLIIASLAAEAGVDIGHGGKESSDEDSD